MRLPVSPSKCRIQGFGVAKGATGFPSNLLDLKTQSKKSDTVNNTGRVLDIHDFISFFDLYDEERGMRKTK